MALIARIQRFGAGRSVLHRLWWLTLVVPLVLAACSGDDDVVALCPKVLRVDDAAKVIRFRGEGRDLTDVVFEARIGAAAVGCEFDDNVLEVDLLVEIEASRGPAETRRSVDISYFVAVADRGRNIIAREAFENSLPFPGNKTRVALREQIEPRIPLQPGQNGSDFFIFVGIEVSKSELDYNRANR